MTTSGGTKIVFHAFAAYVGAVHGQRQVSFWIDDPSSGNIAWNAGALKKVDLAQTPSKALAGGCSWQDVDVDDFTLHGGLTTLGPMFPGGATIGGVWLSESYMKRNGLDESMKPGHAFGHELRMVLYVDSSGKKVTRYQGFHAKVLTPHGQGRFTQLKVWNAGAGKAKGHAITVAVDLDDISDTGESAMTRSSGAGDEGSLYVDYDKKTVYLAGGGTGPKIPPAAGY